LACSRAAVEPRPVASFSSSTGAAQALEGVREEWMHATDGNRAALRPELEAFLARFPKDGLVPAVRVYLALAWMAPPEDWAQGDAILKSMPAPPPGTTNDLYLIATAKGMRHHGDPNGAFDLLRPLVGKMVDPMARGLLEEEVAMDALEAHRDYEAIAYMDAWIRGASEEGRDAVRAKVAKVLTELPKQALVGSLRAMRASGASHGYSIEIERLVAERLAHIAIEAGDPALARWLLDPSAGGHTIGGDTGVALGELASSKRGIGNVNGRTVGLVLPTDSADLRDEAADVARGMAWALELPRTDPKAGDEVRLVTRDAAGGADRLITSLEEIAGEGAAVIVTGLDVASSDAAAEWAEKRKIPVLLLASRHDPKDDAKKGGYAFLVGQPLKPVIEALVAAIESGPFAESGGKSSPSPIAPIVEGDSGRLFIEGFEFSQAAPWRMPVPCDVQAIKAGEPRFPVASWAASGVHLWLLATSAECAGDVIHEVSARGQRGTFAVTLEGAGLTERPPPGTRIVVASAGIVPFGLAPKDEPRLKEALAMTARFGGRSSFWAALGHDAGVLSRKALLPLPLDSVTAEKDIAERRSEVREALLSARASLWTTDEQGFEPGHRAVARVIRAVEMK
jgi:hypothetical protein